MGLIDSFTPIAGERAIEGPVEPGFLIVGAGISSCLHMDGARSCDPPVPGAEVAVLVVSLGYVVGEKGDVLVPLIARGRPIVECPVG